jgi:hypothetical protein
MSVLNVLFRVQPFGLYDSSTSWHVCMPMCQLSREGSVILHNAVFNRNNQVLITTLHTVWRAPQRVLLNVCHYLVAGQLQLRAVRSFAAVQVGCAGYSANGTPAGCITRNGVCSVDAKYSWESVSVLAGTTVATLQLAEPWRSLGCADSPTRAAVLRQLNPLYKL